MARLLRGHGFYVRMHAYEYVLGINNRIFGVLVLEPWRGKAQLYIHKGSLTSEDCINTLLNVLKSIDSKIKINVLYAS
ncbi:MAG: hypothetical protein DRZ82_08180 [Thermoprotei archaeon]|nr:MAG: hypothetical protein DRZ82_08180 [Thermoprotei archaeon]